MAILNGGAGKDVLRGTNGADWLYGGDGDDTLNGLGGNDALFGGSGRDTLNGGAGSDYVDGGLGDDLLIYGFGENKGSYDVFNGGFGTDTLRLVLTAAEWARADVKADVARFLAYLPEYNEPLGWISDPVFTFKSTGLSLVGVNKLEVVVDGKVVNVADAPVVVANDVLATTENAGATVDVLVNDWVADGIKSVSVTQPARGKVELVTSNFAGEAPSAVFRFDPGTAFDALAEGETATQVFTYTVTDKDGDTKKGTVTVTITGTNDAPVAVADAATHIDGSGEILTGSVATNDRDVDGSPADAYYDYNYWEAPSGFVMEADGSWSFDEGFQGLPGELREGENVVYEIPYTVTDALGATSRGTLTFTIKGVNDAPEVNDIEGEVSEDTFYASVEDGVLTQYISIGFYDRDSPDVTVTILGGPDNPVGTLESFGTYDGRADFYYSVDAALVAALGEGETLVQTYRVRLDDGDGGVVEMDFPVTIIGDGEDPTIFLDDSYPSSDVANGLKTMEVEFTFEDEDKDEEIRFEVRPVGEVAGTFEITSTDQWSERREVTVVFTFSEAELAALPDDRAVFQYQIVAIDSAGKETIFDYSLQPREDNYTVGTDGNDDIDAYGDGGAYLIGGAGDDRLVGTDGGDFLYGDEGPEIPSHEEPDTAYYEWSGPVAGFNDELDGGAGADMLHGGEGADRFVFRSGEANGDVVLDFDAASGDRLEFHDYGEGATLRDLGDDRWEIASADGSVRDVITLANGAALTGDGYRFVERPVIWQVGTDGYDLIYAGWDNPEVLIGNGGADKLSGSPFADRIYGDQGPALPDGVNNDFGGYSSWKGEFDDELDGRAGADLLTGGADADLFLFREGEADGDTVVDFNAAEGDRLNFRGYGIDGVFERIGDTNQWRVASFDGFYEDVITFLNAPTITPDDYTFGW